MALNYSLSIIPSARRKVNNVLINFWKQILKALLRTTPKKPLDPNRILDLSFSVGTLWKTYTKSLYIFSTKRMKRCVLHMNRSHIATIAVCIIVVSSLILIPFAGADWIMFRSDPSHSGAVTDNPALTPTLLWNYTTFDDGAGHVYSSPAVVNGVVYITSHDFKVIGRTIITNNGDVFALNAADGTKLWNYTIGPVGESSPAVVNGVVYVGSVDGNVYALNAVSGVKLWSYTTGGLVYSSPTFVGGVIYVGSGDGNVYALNAANGAKLWGFTTGNLVGSSPAVVNGVVYVGSVDGNVYALNAVSGVKLWNYTTGPGGSSNAVYSSPAVVNGVVYIGSYDGNVYALNAANGAKLWSYTTGQIGWSSPAVVGGVVYIGSWDGNIYALNAINGNQLWSYNTGSLQIESSPAVVNGVVYMGSSNGNVYALGSSPSPSPSPSPTSTPSSSPTPSPTPIITPSPTPIITPNPIVSPNPTSTLVLGAPVIELTSSVGNGSEVKSSSIELTWKATVDAAFLVDHYEVKLDNGTWTNIGTQTSYVFIGLIDGNHTLNVKSVGADGLSQTSRINASVTTVVDSGFPLMYLGVVVLLIAVATIAILLVLKFVRPRSKLKAK